MYNGIPFIAKDGHTLRVLHLGRVSTDHQNISNIDASKEAMIEKVLKDHVGEIRNIALGERASGWKIDRKGVKTVMAMIENREVDLVILEDISRAFRNPQWQYRFAHLCVDRNVRFISPGDAIDTARPEWEPMLALAVTRHAMLVPDTRRRVNRTATHSFRNGGMVLKVPYGYERLSHKEAVARASGGKPRRIVKMDAATPVIRQMVEQVLAGDSLEEVARSLNDEGVNPGAYNKCPRWSGKNVSDLLRNPLLSGKRTFRRVTSHIIYETGDYRRERNPHPELEIVPELAHISPEQHDKVLAELERRHPARGPHPRAGIARSDTMFPYQHLRCGVCGAIAYRVDERQLMCKNARRARGERRCWNRTRVHLGRLRTLCMSELARAIRSRPDLLSTLTDVAIREFKRSVRVRSRRLSDSQAQVADLEKRRSNLLDLAESASTSAGWGERLRQIEQELATARKNQAAEELASKDDLALLTAEEVVERLDEVFVELARSSRKFAAVLRRECPNLTIQPRRHVVSGCVVPRLNWEMPTAGDGVPSEPLEIDAFETSKLDSLVQQFLDRPDALQSIGEFGRQAGFTKNIICHARRRLQELEAGGHTQLYQPLEAPPTDVPRWRVEGASGRGAGAAALDSAGNS
jgi:site-specific DNA recombinase